jgi:hypothetical protein
VRVAGEVLDKAVVDRNGHAMGRADGILLELRPGEPPRIAAVLIGPSVLGSRLSPMLGRWAAALESALGVSDRRPFVLDFHDVAVEKNQLKADVAFGESAANAVETLVRRWIVRIPWAK